MLRPLTLLSLSLACAACVTNPCGPDTCGGCCSADGTCELLGSAAACGTGGGLCMACNPGEACSAEGLCAVPPVDAGVPPAAVHDFATGRAAPGAIVISQGIVYWSEQGVGATPFTTRGLLAMCPVSGCPAGGPTTLLSGLQTPGGLTLQSNTLYWTNHDLLLSCPVPGCSGHAVILASLLDGFGSNFTAVGPMGQLATDARSLVYTSTDPQYGIVTLCPRSTGCVPRGDGLLVQSKANLPTAPLLDLSRVYWLEMGTASIKACARTGCADLNVTPTTLATDAIGATVLVQDATRLFWASSVRPSSSGGVVISGTKNKVGAVAKDGSGETVLAHDRSAIFGLAVDDAFVYWTEPTTGNVMKVAKAGGEPVVLAAGEDQPTALALDGDTLYFATRTALRSVAARE